MDIWEVILGDEVLNLDDNMGLVVDMDNRDFSEELNESQLDGQEENVVEDDYDVEARILVGDGKNLRAGV